MTGASIADLAAALQGARVVPYIGPGVFTLLPEGTCPIPRDPLELSRYLNAKVAAPGRIRSSLTAVAQYIESRRHRKTLEAILTDAFRKEVPPTPVHQWLAGLPAPELMVDVWYDDVMERLLAATAGRSWGQIQAVSHPQSVGRWVDNFAADGTLVDAATAAGWRTVLYKPVGGVSPAGNFAVSDSDFVEVLTEIDIQSPIPPAVQARRTGKHFLFLGCRFDGEIQRTFARQIIKRSSDRHWAVIPGELSRNEARFLEMLGVERLDLSLEDAMAQLTEAMTARAG
jgi:hypothetical protein